MDDVFALMAERNRLRVAAGDPFTNLTDSEVPSIKNLNPVAGQRTTPAPSPVEMGLYENKRMKLTDSTNTGGAMEVDADERAEPPREDDDANGRNPSEQQRNEDEAGNEGMLVGREL